MSYLAFLLIAAVAALAAFAVYAQARGVVYLGRTSAGMTIVHDDFYVMRERIRVLEVAGTYQSATYLDERWADPVFPYHRLFDHLFDAWPAGNGPTHVAVLGGGGYAIPKHLVAHHPEITQIEVVEIDPAIERIARRHFFVDRLEERFAAESSGRLRLHVADASPWLAASDQHFDAIINDCFSALAPEETLMTAAGIRMVADHLSHDGVYLTNVVSALEGPDATIFYGVIDALQQTFAHVWVYPCSAHQPTSVDNNVVIATNTACHFDGAWEWPTPPKEAR